MRKSQKQHNLLMDITQESRRYIHPKSVIENELLNIHEGLKLSYGEKATSIFLNDNQYQEEREYFIGSIFLLGLRSLNKREYLIKHIADTYPDFSIYFQDDKVPCYQEFELTEITPSIDKSNFKVESAITQLENTKFRDDYIAGKEGLLIWLNCNSSPEVAQGLVSWLRYQAPNKWVEVHIVYLNRISDAEFIFTLISVIPIVKQVSLDVMKEPLEMYPETLSLVKKL